MLVRGLQSPPVWLLAAGVGAVVALGQMLPARFGGGMPQVPGEDVLALVLGDGRQALSAAMMEKAEEYFHGGVRDVVCEAGLAAVSQGHGEEEHDHEHEASVPSGSFDPWSWVDGRVHAQEHRHLEHNEAVELLPWIWAACRASPKNVEAYEAGSYVLASMAGKPEAGVQLLEEGVRNNPACAALDFALGELLLNKVRDAGRAEPWFFSAREKCRPAEGDAGEEARTLRVKALFYLGYLAKQRGELDRLAAYYKEAEALEPLHVCTKNLRDLLGQGK